MSEFKTEWVHQYAPSARVMFDIGAYDGADTLRFAAALSGVELRAFECDFERFRTTEPALREHGIVCEYLALCDRDGPVKFHANRDECMGTGPGASGSILPPTAKLLGEHPHLTFVSPLTVLGMRLDTYCERTGVKPDVLHMDVQGAEWNVITGLGELRPTMIYLETAEVMLAHYEGSRDAEELLVSLGYSKRWSSSYDALYVL